MDDTLLRAALANVEAELAAAEERVTNIRAAAAAIRKLLHPTSGPVLVPVELHQAAEVAGTNGAAENERARPPLRDSVRSVLGHLPPGAHMDLADLSEWMMGQDLIGAANAKTARETIRQVLNKLVDEGLVERHDDGYCLTEPGWQRLGGPPTDPR